LQLDLLGYLQFHELSYVTLVVNILSTIFQEDFDKILEEDYPIDCELDYSKFLLSRCELLCPEPTYSSFLLVSAFLDNLIVCEAGDQECFETLYISEFCLLVLYRRLFWKIFNSEEGHQNLKKFCDEFHKNFTDDSTLSDLRNTCVGLNWIKVVQDCVNATDVHFSLEDVDIKQFENYYSTLSYIDCKSEASREIESLFPLCEMCKRESFANIVDLSAKTT
ncbi:hypothetical protein TNIN_52371, partial [Trichonephila inaurata madagascariensis]